jgi:hypothetical protein
MFLAFTWMEYRSNYGVQCSITARNHDGKDGHCMWGGAVKDYKTVSLLVNIVMVDVMGGCSATGLDLLKSSNIDRV